MASSCSFLQLRLSQSPNFSVSRPLNLSNPSRRSSSSSSLCLSQISAKSQKPISLLETGENSNQSINSIVNPSLHYANVMFFRTAYNVQIVVDEDEPEEVLLRRFRREVSKAGVIQECKRRKFFENKQEEKKRRNRDAAKRNRRRRYEPRPPQPAVGDAAGPKKAAEDDDNWDIPAGGLPY